MQATALEPIMDYFPMERPRPAQIEALEFIQRAVEDGFNDITISAPTGVGKSAVGATTALWADSYDIPGYLTGGYYLVTQKMLQDQLEHDFPRYLPRFRGRAASLKSSSEYFCAKNGTCMVGGLAGQKDKAQRCPQRQVKTCPYVSAYSSFSMSHMAITNYPYLFTEHLYVGKHGPRNIIVADECFPGDTLIETETGPVRIDCIQTGTRVLCYGPHGFEHKNVVKTHSTGHKKLVRVTTEKGDIRCTHEHRLLTTTGWQAAGALIPGDMLLGCAFGKHTALLNDDQLQLVIGSFLGDGSLTAVPGGLRLRWTHGIKQKNYCAWKACLLDGKVTGIEENGYAGMPAVRAASRAFRLDAPVFAPPKRHVPDWMLNALDVKALAIWFMDDGSAQHTSNGLAHVILHTESFSKSACHKLVGALRKRFSLRATVQKAKHRYWIIVFNKKNATRLADIVAPFIHPELAYKLKLTPPSMPAVWDSEFRPQQVKVKNVSPVRAEQPCFDLEVADNHTYVVRTRFNKALSAWSKTGVIVHNCHTLEKQITGFVEVLINKKTLDNWAPACRPVPKMRYIDEFASWLTAKYIGMGKERLDMLQENMLLNPTNRKMQSEYSGLKSHLGRIEHAVSNMQTDPDGWVFWQELEEGELACIAKPLSAAPFVPELINQLGATRVYMSAYPGPKDVFCRSLGINPKRMAWLELDSAFPAENRMVHMTTVGSMGRACVDATTPRLLRMCETILESHANDKGIIHTHSYALGQKIHAYLSRLDSCRGRVLFATKAAERTLIFNRHRESKQATVLISPSMTEGYSFDDDLARFQIIAKVPFGYLGDRQVAAKMKLDGEWYMLQTVMTIIQACGRIVRSETDHGDTYILDSDFIRVYEENQKFFPAWFKAAFKFYEPA